MGYWKLGQRRVLEPLQRGDLHTAIQRAGKERASQPGSPSGQVQAGYTEAQATAYYAQRLAHYQQVGAHAQGLGPVVPKAELGVDSVDSHPASAAAPRDEPASRARVAAALDLTGPAHLDARLLAQAVAAIDRLDSVIGRQHDATTDRAAAALVVAARRDGLASIDHVLLSDDGGRLFAVQGEPGSPLSHIAFVATAHATRQSVEASTRELAGIGPG